MNHILILDANEIYKPIFSIGDNLQPYYFINNYSEVFSDFSGKFLKTSISESGYLVVSLNTIDGKRIQRRVHRLAMMTFKYFPGCENYQVDHLDGNKFNNNIENLEWVTAKENVNRAIKNNLRKSWTKENPKSIINEYIAIDIADKIIKGYTDEEILHMYPQINKSIISCIANGHTWSEFIDNGLVEKMKKIRNRKILDDFQVHEICNYFQNNPNQDKNKYGGNTLYIKKCILELNLPNNEQIFRVVKSIYYKHQYKDIASLYNY